MRSIFVAGFIVVVCVMANDSAEKPDSNEKTDLKESAPVPAAAGAHALECKKNETSGCQPCGVEKTCHTAASAAPATPCSAECKPACVCSEGYVKGLEGHCILLADCPK